MVGYNRIFFIISAFLFSNLNAIVIQTNSIIPIEQKIKQANSSYIIIVEITNTLIIPKEHVFQDKRLFKKFFLQLLEDKKVEKEDYEKILQNTKFKLSDQKWKKLITWLMNNDIKVFGFELGKNDNIKALKEDNMFSNLAFKNILYIKNFKKNMAIFDFLFKYKNVIIISSNRKFLEKFYEYIENNKKKGHVNFVLFEYTYLNNLPKIASIDAKKEIIRLSKIK